MGRLLYDLGSIDKRTIDKYQREADAIGKGSFAFAWVLDSGSDEREHGVTMDVAMNRFETESTRFTILDAPGHKDFVPMMIAGASQADFAVLVVDASTSAFESGMRGQTKEHALLVRSIGVQKLIVAVNKMDAVDWSKDRFDEIRHQMTAFLTTAGFQQANLTFIPCAGLRGTNILKSPADRAASWYSGHTLVQELETSEPRVHAFDKPFRMIINDVFRDHVKNDLSISGRITVGYTQVGEQILCLPGGETPFITGIEVDQEPLDYAVAGQNVVFRLTELEEYKIRAGHVVCSPVAPAKMISQFKAKVLSFNHLMPMRVDVIRDRMNVAGAISRLVATLDKSTGAMLKKRPKVTQPGQLVEVIVDLKEPAPLEAGRIVFREGGETIAAGWVE